MNRLLAGSLKRMMIVMSVSASANALSENIQIVGVGGHLVTLKDKTWGRPAAESAVASFTANGKTFPLYVPAVGTETHEAWLPNGAVLASSTASRKRLSGWFIAVLNKKNSCMAGLTSTRQLGLK